MTDDLVLDPPDEPQLPGAILPLLIGATERMCECSDGSGRLMLAPGEHSQRNWFDVSAVAIALTESAQGNPLCGDGRVADLLRQAGEAIREHIEECNTNDPNALWFNSDRPHEWILENWLVARQRLHAAGAAELCGGWDDALRGAGAVFGRYCEQIEHLRTLRSPNLKISPNHFIYFATVLLRIGQVLEVEPFYELGLRTAKRLAEVQHADGYWPESHGPTTSYNYVSTAAMGLCDAYTAEPIFREVCRRALAFHAAYSYPDGTALETIDQRVRYRRNRGERMMAMFAFSHWPEGRGLAEMVFANGLAGLRAFDQPAVYGRLAQNYLHYRSGETAAPACLQRASHARLSDLPAGVVHRRPWLVGLCGIPSRPRPHHHYTLDRQNLLSLWHRDVGLICGGGNNRFVHEAATFRCQVPLDEDADLENAGSVDAYIPVDASCQIGSDGGRLLLQYDGFDATLDVQIVDGRMCRLTASTGGLGINAPITFALNLQIHPGEPVVTAAGKQASTAGASWVLPAVEMGDWIAHAGWRIELPAEATLSYPMSHWKQAARLPAEHYALLSLPLTNAEAVLTVRVL